MNLLLFIVSVILLSKEGYSIFNKEKLSFTWTKGLLKVGGISGAESFVRNVAYMLMISRMVNMVNDGNIENRLLDTLDSLGVSYVRNGSDCSLPGLISLSFAGKDGEAILHRVDLMGISISTGSACDSRRTEISHVLKALKLPTELAKGTIRISLGKNNTESEIDFIANAIAKVVL